MRVRVLAACCARGLRNVLPSQSTEGAGKAGCRLHPWVPCKKSTGVGPQVQPETTRLSLRDGFTTYFVLSSVTGLFCHCRPRKTSRELGASIGAPGPHDFA